MRRVEVPEVPYVKAALDGSLDLHDFLRTQLQYFFAVEAYPACLALLAARLKSPAARRAVEEHVRDEVGGGDSGRSHVHTFRALLAKLGVTGAEIDGSPRWQCVLAFNEGVKAACTSAPENAGLATVAAIEDLFTGISRDLGSAIAGRGWLSKDEIVHYNVNQQIDRVHADALYLQLDETAQRDIEQGLATGLSLMTGLYDGLLRER